MPSKLQVSVGNARLGISCKLPLSLKPDDKTPLASHCGMAFAEAETEQGCIAGVPPMSQALYGQTAI